MTNIHCLWDVMLCSLLEVTIISLDDGGNMFHWDVGELPYCAVLHSH